MNYPLLAKDGDTGAYVFVRVEGGWFEEDDLYLVAFNVDDLLANNRKKDLVESAIQKYKDDKQ